MGVEESLEKGVKTQRIVRETKDRGKNKIQRKTVKNQAGL